MADQEIETLRQGIDALVRVFKIADAQPLPDGSAPLNPSDVQSLMYVATHKGCIASDIVRFLGVPATSVSTIIDRLVGRSLLHRTRTDKNRRVIVLSLTTEGYIAVEAILAEQRLHCAAMLNALPPEQRSGFVAQIAHIAREIERR